MLQFRQRKAKSRADSGLGRYPDAPSVTFDDPFTDGQADPGSWVLLPGLDPLENDENALKVIGGNTDPIILHRYNPLMWFFLHPHPDQGLGPSAAKLDGVGDQVLKNLGELRTVSHHGR